MESHSNQAEVTFERCSDLLLRGGYAKLYGQPLFQKLAEVYCEEALQSHRSVSSISIEKILGKLVKRDKLNCLVLNLYRDIQGYSLSVMSSGIETETIRLPYEDNNILSYIDEEALPPMLLDLLVEANIELFYSGCIIVEIRDYRRAIDPPYECRHVLLKPTNQSILADVATLSKGQNWTMAEKLELESLIVAKLNPVLDLSPSPMVGVMKNRIHCHKYKFCSVASRRAARRFSQVAINRAKSFENCKPSKSLKLLAFLKSKKDRKTPASISFKSVDHTKERMDATEDSESNVVDNIDLLKQQREMQSFYAKIAEDVRSVARPIERPHESPENVYAFMEEYILETERSQGRIYLTKLIIHQRLTDEVYFGELYVDRDYQDGQERGSSCRFALGTQHQVRRYIQQFKEILTEEGRKSVKIVHRIAGQAPKLLTTPVSTRDRKDLEQLKQQQLALQQELEKSKMESQNQTLQKPLQSQAMQQNVLTAFNICGQTTTALPLTSPAGTSVGHQASANLIIVSNADGNLKKSLTMVGNTVTSGTNNFNSLMSTQGVQHTQVGQQQMVVGRNVNLANLLSGRQVNPSSGSSQTQNTHQMGAKVAVNVQTGTSTTKLSLPMLAAQLNRPAPSYSQSISTNKSMQSTASDSNVKVEPKNTEQTQTRQVNASLQALLAGTPSADNPNPHSKGSALLERLSAQSFGLNTLKKHQPEETTSSTSNTAGSNGQASNINLTNMSGLNVGIPNLTTNLQPLQNVQVSIPGLSTPISFTLNNVSPSSSGVVVTSSPQILPNTRTTGSPVVSSPATVMITSQPGLQQGQVVQLPLGQISGSQLATHLTKSVNSSSSSIPLLQIQGGSGGNNLFTSIRGNSGLTSSPSPQSMQVTLAQTLSSTSSEAGTMAQNSSTAGGSIVTLTSKQPMQLAMSKQPSYLTWQLQQKLIAAKRQQHQQSQQQQQPPR